MEKKGLGNPIRIEELFLVIGEFNTFMINIGIEAFSQPNYLSLASCISHIIMPISSPKPIENHCIKCYDKTIRCAMFKNANPVTKIISMKTTCVGHGEKQANLKKFCRI